MACVRHINCWRSTAEAAAQRLEYMFNDDVHALNRRQFNIAYLSRRLRMESRDDKGVRDLRQRMADGAAWMVAARLADRTLGFVCTLVLARLLMPSDFGLIAMATSLLAFVELFASFGFDTALVRDQGAGREHFDTAWTLQLLALGMTGTLMALIAYPASWFFFEPRLVPIVLCLALVSLVQGCENIGVVAFRKELDFRREFLYMSGKKLCAVGVTIPLAFAFQNYWALVGGIVIGRVAGVVLSYIMHPYRPRLSLSRWRELFKFSKWLLIVNGIDFIKFRYADLILGRMAGPSVLGIYSVGTDIGMLASTELGAPINRAVFPALSRIGHDIGALRMEFVAVLGVMAIVILPASVGLSATASLFVPLLLGDRWVEAAVVVSGFAWVGAFAALQNASYPVFLAIGKPWLETRLRGIHVLMLVPTLPIMASYYGLVGVIWSTLIICAITLPIAFSLVCKELRLDLRQLTAVIWRPVLASLLMWLSVTQLVECRLEISSIVRVVAAVALGLVVYPSLLFAIWWLSGKPFGAEVRIAAHLSSIARSARQ